MWRKTCVQCVVLASMFLVPEAMAAKGDWRLSIAGGISAPTGDFGKEATQGGLGAKLGFNVGPDVDYMLTENLAVGVDGSFIKNDLSSDSREHFRTLSGDPTFEGKYTQIGGGAHMKYWFPMTDSPVAVYAVGGVGAMNFKEKAESANPTYNTEESKTQFMAHGGVGAGYKANEKITVGVEGDFDYVKLDESTFAFTSATGFGVKAALTFEIPRGAR